SGRVTQHSIFGLTLSSDHALPGLSVGPSSGVDVVIHLGTLPARDVASATDLHLTFDEGLDVLVDREGTRIWAAWRNPLTLADVTSYLVGPVLGLVLRLRGVTCLHASAVCIDGRAVVFAGCVGSGKSTLAAAFAAWGDPVLSDDLVAVRVQGDTGLVAAGPPWLRLRNAARGPLEGSICWS